MGENNRNEFIGSTQPFGNEGYARLFNSMPYPTAITSADAHHILAVNDALCAVTGYSRDELLGKTAMALGLIAQPVVRLQALEAVNKAGATTVEIKFRMKSGEIVSFLMTSNRLEWPGGAIYLSIFQSQHEKVTPDVKHQEVLMMFHPLLDSLQNAVAIARHGIHEYVNPAYLKLFGFSDSSELEGRPIYEQIAPQDRSWISEHVDLHERGIKEHLLNEVRGLRRDGSQFDLEVSLSIYELNGEFFTMTVMRDITEQNALTLALCERLKEMTCLAEVRRLAAKSTSIESLCREVLNALIRAQQYPDITMAMIDLDGRQFLSQRFLGQARVGLRANIVLDGKRRGEVAVYHLINKNFLLPEKQDLIEGIAEELALWVKHKLTTTALHTTEKSYRKIIETAQEGIYIFDPSGHLTFFNDRLASMFGYSRDELLGRSIDEFILETDRDSADARGEEIQSGKLRVFENAYRTKGGEPVWLLVSRSAMIENGEVTGYLGVAIDITERKRVEEALTQSEGLFRAVFQTGADAFVIINLLTSRIVDANEQFSKLYGFTHDEVIGKTYLELGLWAEPEKRADLMKAIESHDRIENYEILARRKNGETFNILYSGNKLKMGKDTLLLGVIHDITDRIQIEETLRNRNQMLLTLYKTALQVGVELRLPQLFSNVLEELQSLLHADRGGGVYLYDEAKKVLRMVYGTGINKGRDGREVQLGVGIIGRVFETGEPIFVNDYAHWEGRVSFYSIEPPHAVLAVPLFVKSQVIGVLTFTTDSKKSQFGQQDIQQAQMLAAQVAIAIQNARLFEALELKNQELAVAYDATIEGWSKAMELRDEETEGHTQRVTEMSVRLARAIGMDEAALVQVRRGALLHDIGKMAIPDAILLKPGPLTDEEMNIMRRHPVLALQMLSPIGYLQPAIAIPYCHHEKWDGSGYPRGLKGEEIPLEARVFAVVDVWDALTSDRPYRQAWPREQALEYIIKQTGAHFDPAVVSKFLELIKIE